MNRSIIVAAALALASAASAQHYEQGDIHIMGPWSRALPPVAKNGAAYLRLNNHGASPDRLLGASSPAADRVEIHTHTMDGGVMRMRRVDFVELPPGEYVVFEPGGLHLMLFGLKKPLKEGETFAVTLEFERAQPAEVSVTVKPIDAGTGGGGHGHGQHGGHDEKDGGQSQMHHGAPMSMAANDAPALDLTLRRAASGAYVLHLDTARFRFAKDHAGGPHVPGEGHAHLYVDGEKVARIYGAEYQLGALEPGVREIAVGLFTNNHAAYAADGVAVAERIVLRVPASPGKAGDGRPMRFDLPIRAGKVDASGGTIRVSEGDDVALRWSADEDQQLHLHGFDIEAAVGPHSPVTMWFAADLTGRFPVAVHGSGSGHGHGHDTLVYLEVHPR